jgi:uncharacterized protein (DUF2344 family)
MNKIKKVVTATVDIELTKSDVINYIKSASTEEKLELLMVIEGDISIADITNYADHCRESVVQYFLLEKLTLYERVVNSLASKISRLPKLIYRKE